MSVSPSASARHGPPEVGVGDTGATSGMNGHNCAMSTFCHTTHPDEIPPKPTFSHVILPGPSAHPSTGICVPELSDPRIALSSPGPAYSGMSLGATTSQTGGDVAALG